MAKTNRPAQYSNPAFHHIFHAFSIEIEKALATFGQYIYLHTKNHDTHERDSMQLFSDPALTPWLTILGAALALLSVLGVIAIVYSFTLRVRLMREVESARIEVARLKAHLESREAANADLENRNILLERNLMNESQARAGLAASLEAAEKSKKEQAESATRNETRLREAFSALSAEALGRNNRLFLDLAKAQLGEFNKSAAAELELRKTAVDSLIKPIGEHLGKMDASLKEAEKLRAADHGSLMTLHGQLSQETHLLTRALHHSSARGHWGELQLRRVVEMAGMLEHCDFDVQVSASGREGSRLRPDLIVHLAGGRSLVVDAKAPMENYLKSIETNDRAQEQEFLSKHARDIKARITELGAKSYWDSFDNTPEFVVMFFPSENVFSDALKYDPDLIDFGATNSVIPASPVTLIALLRAAAYGWRQEKATENAKQIFELGCELHDRFAKEYQHIANIGVALSRAVDSFNKSAGSAERMLFPTLRKFSGLIGKDLFPAPEDVGQEPRRLTSEIENDKNAEEDDPEKPQE